jgi:hypothetical protein
VTAFTLVKSVAVHAMKIFFVDVEILEWSPLMMGGMERTTPFLSVMTG